MNKIKQGALIVFGMLFVMVPLVNLVYAQTNEDIVGSTVGMDQENSPVDEDITVNNENIIILANVNIWDAKISNQDGNKLTIDFDINNGIGKSQPNIRYAIQLFDKGNESRKLVSEKVFSDVVNVPENTTIHKTVSYVAPEYLKGDFDVDIISESSGGLPLGGTTAGSITLDGSGEYIDIQNESCFLTIKNSSDKKKYTLQDSISIEKNQEAVISCDIKSNFKKNEKVIPYINIYQRDYFGKKIREEKGEAIELAPGKTKTAIFNLSGVDKPQSYDVVVMFKKDGDVVNTSDDTNNIISNKIFFRYIVAGMGASIQNIRLSKDYYQKGDSAVVVLNWLKNVNKLSGPEITTTEEPSIIAEVNIKSSDGKKCAEAVREKMNETSQMKNVAVVIPIVNDCLNPSGTVKLVAEDGTIFDQQEFQIKSNSTFQPKKDFEKNNEKKLSIQKIMAIGVTILGIIVIVGLIVIVIRRNKKSGGMMSLLLILLTAGIVFSTKNVEATTFSASVPGLGFGIPITVQMNKSVYRPRENATLSMRVNGSVVGTAMFLKHSRYNFSASFNGHSLSRPGSVSGSVESRSGRYNAGVSAYESICRLTWLNTCNWGSSSRIFSGSVPYTVRSVPRPPAKTNPRAIIDVPSNNSTFQQGQRITFAGHGVLGTGGGRIDEYFWADVRPGTPSYRGTRCACADGFGNRCLITSGSTSTYRTTGLTVGNHRICFNVRQRYTDRTVAWANPIDNVDIKITTPPPIVDLKINGSGGPISNVSSGGDLRIAWTVQNATSCLVTSGDGWTGSKNSSRGNDNVLASTTSTYTLSCTGPGGTGSDSVQVNLCVPNLNYSCQKTNDKTSYCANHCGEIFTQKNRCFVSDGNSCSPPASTVGIKRASVCANHNTTCSATEPGVSCPACANESNWIEVKP